MTTPDPGSTRHSIPPPEPPAPTGLGWQQQLGARVAYAVIRAVEWTVRFRLIIPEARRRELDAAPVLFAAWHNRLTFSLIVYEKLISSRRPRRRLAAMVSMSRDGGLMARILHLFNVLPVRGSTSRRGPQALLELAKAARRGYDLALTPDGPRGPRYKVQSGVIALAQLTGMDIVPVSYRLSRKIEANNWDRHQIPLPFCRCDIVLGETLKVPCEADEIGREAMRQRLEASLLAITED